MLNSVKSIVLILPNSGTVITVITEFSELILKKLDWLNMQQAIAT